MIINIIANGAVIDFWYQRKAAKDSFEQHCHRNLYQSPSHGGDTLQVLQELKETYVDLDQPYRKWTNTATGDVFEMKRIE
jgi:hypothetical protein